MLGNMLFFMLGSPSLLSKLEMGYCSGIDSKGSEDTCRSYKPEIFYLRLVTFL